MIRAATSRDVAQLARLDHACFEPQAWTAEQIEQSLSVPTRAAWVCGAEGYAMVSTAAEVTDLERIAVAPGARRQGIGRRLVEVVLEHASRGGALRVLIEVAVDNEPAITLYRAAGGGVIARRRDYYGSGRDALVLQIEVDA